MGSARVLSSELDRLVERIRDGYEPEKTILFGSPARGDTREDSDIDLIIAKDADASYGERDKEISPVLRGLLVGADIVICMPEEYEDGKQARRGLVRDMERDGRVLYERV